MKKWGIINFVALLCVWLGADLFLAAYKHDWRTPEYWLDETGIAVFSGLFAALLAMFAESRKPHRPQPSQRPDADRQHTAPRFSH